jgi:hypothetical protein
VRITVVIPGPAKVLRATLFTRAQEAQSWSASPMKLDGRRTYTAELHWQEISKVLGDYYVAVEVEGAGGPKTLVSPPEAPRRFYTVTLN